ncbi:MAG: 3-phosphoshikimate 1-carboxyvinyltransferase [Sphaerochaetaceae bacterium]|nr:3-phosphoshikimate 1-carboxyvinyltransferase [Sphaerochaetaceae bacterium]
MDITLTPSAIQGSVQVPASKSQTIRALLIALFASQSSTVRHPLYSSDTRSALEACVALGAILEESEQRIILTPPSSFPRSIEIDCANSGTTLYLLAAMIAATDTRATFTGDEQLKRRPVAPLVETLASLGASVEYQEETGYPPFTVQGPITGGKVTMYCHTSQYLSGILLSSVMSPSSVHITVPLLNEIPYVRMTLAWLEKQGQAVSYTDTLDFIEVTGGGAYHAFDEKIAGDFSSASFFFCAAAITHSTLTIEGLDRNDPQGDKEVLVILEKMGCSITWKDDCVTVSLDPERNLKGGTFDLNAIPDALPVLAVTAAFAEGTTVLANVPQARIKETDRIATMRANLEVLGVEVEEREDALIVHGRGRVHGGTVQGYDDHRIIMAMAIASLAAQGDVTIQGIDAVEVTFPTFFTLLASITKENEND